MEVAGSFATLYKARVMGSIRETRDNEIKQELSRERTDLDEKVMNQFDPPIDTFVVRSDVGNERSDNSLWLQNIFLNLSYPQSKGYPHGIDYLGMRLEFGRIVSDIKILHLIGQLCGHCGSDVTRHPKKQQRF